MPLALAGWERGRKIEMHAHCFYDQLTDPPLECSHARTRFPQIHSIIPNWTVARKLIPEREV